MTIQWNDEVVASIDGPQGRDILIQAPLKIVVPFLAARSSSERARMLLAFADRSAPPFRYEGRDIVPLLNELQRWRSKAKIE